jgi:hypothetical protein
VPEPNHSPDRRVCQVAALGEKAAPEAMLAAAAPEAPAGDSAVVVDGDAVRGQDNELPDRFQVNSGTLPQW